MHPTRAERIFKETNVVVLEPDIVEAFPNDKAVNDALRGLLNIISSTHLTKVSNLIHH